MMVSDGVGARRSAAWAVLPKMLAPCILLIALAEVAEARVIKIRWSSPNPPSAVTGFRIYTRAADESFGAPVYDGKPAAIADVYSIQLTVSDVDGTYVAARAYNSTGESARSNVKFFAAPVCGNAVVEAGEGCDDGNAVGGDGCSATCFVESNPNAPVAYLINAGGAGFLAPSGKVWSADAGFANGGRTAFHNVPVDNTTNDRLYQFQRYGRVDRPPLVLEFPVTGIGPYRVRLHFAELDAAVAKPGMRVFNVTAENAVTIEDVDVFASVGFARAHSRIAYINVDDGALTLSFEPVVGEPMIAGVEISEQQPQTEAPEFVDPCDEFPADCQ